MVIRNKLSTYKNTESPLILVDGTCVICNRFARFVLERDKEGLFFYASIHSDLGKKIIEEWNLSTVDSILLLYQGQVFIYSSAVLQIFKFLGRPWNLIYYSFIVFPVFLRDLVYKASAKKRFFFGQQKDTCLIPSTDINNRILK